jgi:hypothetical protein
VEKTLMVRMIAVTRRTVLLVTLVLTVALAGRAEAQAPGSGSAD